jgi:REP element-mobilizing transposase RayT
MNGSSAALRGTGNAPSMPHRRHLYHVAPSWVGSGEAYFITICCASRHENQLATKETFAVLAKALEHYIAAGKIWAHLFLAMPDHLHALFSFPPAERMDAVIRSWKRFVAKEAGVKWQHGFFDHRLRRNESFQEKARYVRMNPVRAGLVEQPEMWTYVWPANPL